MEGKMMTDMTNEILDDAIDRLKEIEKIENIDDSVGQSYFHTTQEGSPERAKIFTDRGGE